MSAERVVIAHLSDLHFGGYADLAQIEALEAFLPTLGAGRHRHLRRPDPARPARRVPGGARLLQPVAPARAAAGRARATMTSSGGRVRSACWASSAKYQKYSRYFRELRPVLEIPGAVIAGALSSYGVALGSLTWNIRDVAVKGHLPARETDRVTAIFAKAPPGAGAGARVPSQRAARRAFAADGARPLAHGAPPPPRHRRRRHPLRARPPGGRRDRSTEVWP